MPAALVAGVCTWTFMEYALHYWVFHLGRGRTLGSREHLHHHADPTYFSPTWLKIAFAVPVLAVMFGVGLLVLPVVWMAPFTIGVGAAWAGYELFHYQAHVAAPTTRLGARLRKNHFHHHFVAPLKNHGVTSMFWDRALGTHVPAVERVPVPAKHVHALAWVLGPDGAIAEAHRADYELVRTDGPAS